MLIFGNNFGELKSLDLNKKDKKVRIISEDLISIDPSPINIWTVTSITSNRWVSNLSGTTTTSPTDLPSVNYDRIIYCELNTHGNIDLGIYLEISPGTFRKVSRGVAYGGGNAIIPAGVRFRCQLDGTGSAGAVANFTMMKFGR